MINNLAAQEFAEIRDQLLALMERNELLAYALEPEDYDQNLADINAIGSMDSAELIALIEEEFGVVIPEQLFAAELQSVNDVVGYLAAALLESEVLR